MSRHRESRLDVRLRFGAISVAVGGLSAALVASGFVMASGFLGQHGAQGKPTRRQANDVVRAPVLYSGPLPTGMVGLVTIGATPSGTRPTTVVPVSETSSSASRSAPATADVVAAGAQPSVTWRTSSAAQPATTATRTVGPAATPSATPSSAPPSTVTFYPWPTAPWTHGPH